MYIFLTQIYFYLPEIFKKSVSTRFWSTNTVLNLCSRFLNSQRLFCSQKGGIMFELKLSEKKNKFK